MNSSCPILLSDYPKVLIAHGSGGRMMQQLIEKIFYQAFGNPALLTQHDGAVVDIPTSKLACTTDSYVVKPIFFPGGDIGSLAVYGTVNDLAMCGARPLYLTASFIIEEGFAMEDLWKIVQSMSKAANETDTQIITGDTKVVNKGSGDKIFINTTGIGTIEHDLIIAPVSIQPNDAVIISGDIGRHGIAIMSEREGIEFESTMESDTAPLVSPVLELLHEDIEIHCMRDATRGGIAAVLNEIAEVSGLQIEIEENLIPINKKVQGACEVLGLNPLYIANEGCFIAFVPEKHAKKALEIIKRHEPCKNACVIGNVLPNQQGLVTLKTLIGGEHILDMPSGELLPRIC